MNKIFTAIIGIFIIVTIGFLTWIFIQSLIEADPEIKASIIGGIAVLAVGIWSHYSTKRLEINSLHFIEKKNAYMHLITLIFDLFKATKNEIEITEQEKLERLFKFKQELMVWGDQKVIKALDIYEKKSIYLQDNKNLSESILIVDDLLREIRKDLGHNDTGMERGQLVCMLIKTDDREKIIFNNFSKENK